MFFCGKEIEILEKLRMDGLEVFRVGRIRMVKDEHVTERMK